MTDDLINFLRERFTEREAQARTIHDAWVVADAQSKLRILDDVLPNMQSDEIRIAGEWGIGSDPIRETSDDLLSFLALPYADHPDYRAEWRP